ncbi:MAG: Na+/H+ antiporter subunit E, partial [Actinomycetota bacterium]
MNDATGSNASGGRGAGMTDRTAAPAATTSLDREVVRRRALGSLWRSFDGALTGVRRIVALFFLVIAWCALWGSFTVANVASGVIVGVLVLAVGFGGRSAGSIRVGPLARFTLLVSIDLVTSTFSVMREVLTPTDHTDEGIIAVDLPPGSSD